MKVSGAAGFVLTRLISLGHSICCCTTQAPVRRMKDEFKTEHISKIIQTCKLTNKLNCEGMNPENELTNKYICCQEIEEKKLKK